MSRVSELGYVEIQSNNFSAWENLLLNALGMQLAEKSEDVLSFRIDDYQQRISITKGDAEDVTVFGWEVASRDALIALVDKLRKAGVKVDDGGKSLADKRFVGSIYVCEDPDGNRLELFCDPKKTASPFKSEKLISNFVTKGQGLGHFFLLAKKPREEVRKFYTDLLGFRISDYIIQELAPGMIADAVFMHCNPRHHTMAIANLPIPKNIHHLMVEVDAIEDVGHAYDRVNAAGIPLELSLGMHPNDKMFSFYVRTPSGFSIEFGFGGIEIDDNNWTVKTFDKLSEWGHKPVPAPVA